MCFEFKFPLSNITLSKDLNKYGIIGEIRKGAHFFHSTVIPQLLCKNKEYICYNCPCVRDSCNCAMGQG